jgi:hypothetical protein
VEINPFPLFSIILAVNLVAANTRIAMLTTVCRIAHAYSLADLQIFIFCGIAQRMDMPHHFMARN